MRLLGLDVGEKTIGVAVSDPMGWTAQGVTVIREDVQGVGSAALNVRQRQGGEVRGGLPVDGGSYGPETDKIYQFGAELKGI